MLLPDSVDCSPLTFFSLRCPLFRLSKGGKLIARHRLPNSVDISSEEAYSKVFMGWESDRVAVRVEVASPPLQTFYPKVWRGDAVELFFDTRDVKTSGFNTRFCHHFFFLPKSADERQKGEMTTFRTEDAHKLCDEEALELKTSLKKDSYTMDIVIPKGCLVGFDPEEMDRLGFSYRISRAYGAPQHFSASSEEFDIGQQPSLWASMELYPL